MSKTGAPKPGGPTTPDGPARPVGRWYRPQPATSARPIDAVGTLTEPEADAAPEPEPAPDATSARPIDAVETLTEPAAAAPEAEPVPEPVPATRQRAPRKPVAPGPAVLAPEAVAAEDQEPAASEAASAVAPTPAPESERDVTDPATPVPANAAPAPGADATSRGIRPRMVDRLAAARIWLTTPRSPITWALPESEEPAPAEESATVAATLLTGSIASRLAAARVWVTTARPPITWAAPGPAELKGSAAAEAPALESDPVAPIIAEPAEPDPVAPIIAEPAEPDPVAPPVAAPVEPAEPAEPDPAAPAEPDPVAPPVAAPVVGVTAVGLWDATTAPAMVPEPASGEIVETTPEAGPATIAASVETAFGPAPDATVEPAVAGALVEGGPATIAASAETTFGPPETLTWAHFAGPTVWTPPVADIAWPATLTAEAWPVVDPGTRAAGTWRSAGYRSSARRGTALDRALFASAALLGVAGAVIVAAGALPSAAAIVDLTALVPLAASIIAAVLLGTLALALAWLGRAVDNVPPLTGRTPWLSPRQVMGLSLVPGFHLVIPWMAVEDLANRVLPPGRATIRKAVRAWAGVLAAAQGLALAAATVAAPAPSGLRAAALLAGALSAVLLYVVVRRVEDRASRVALVLGLGGSTTRRWPAFPEPPPVADEPSPVADEPPPVADEPPPVADEPPPVADEPPPPSAGRPRRRRA